MSRSATALVLALALLAFPATVSFAQRSGGHGRSGGGSHGGTAHGGPHGSAGWHGHGGSHGWHGGGGWHGHNGHWRGSVFVGGPWWYDPWWGWPYPHAYAYPYYGVYGYPYPYYPPPYGAGSYPYAGGSSEYVQQEPPPESGKYPTGYWYYCASSKGYYPTVQQCPEDWIKVPPAPR